MLGENLRIDGKQDGREGLTAPSMMRTMSHLKVQMEMRERGQLRGTWDSVHTGHRKMARKPVSSS